MKYSSFPAIPAQLGENEIKSPDSKKSRNRQDWYDYTYQLFINQPLDSIDDFWKIVAFTYSWMPVIPRINPNELKDHEDVLKNLRRLRENNSEGLETLLYQLVPLINNSLVGTSKVLHFVAPHVVPIIDKNVLAGLGLIWDTQAEEAPIKFPKNRPLGKNDIPEYLNYQEYMVQWAAKAQVELRNLEDRLFQFGRNHNQLE